jgi:hypothetical protein
MPDTTPRHQYATNSRHSFVCTDRLFLSELETSPESQSILYKKIHNLGILEKSGQIFRAIIAPQGKNRFKAECWPLDDHFNR